MIEHPAQEMRCFVVQPLSPAAGRRQAAGQGGTPAKKQGQRLAHRNEDFKAIVQCHRHVDIRSHLWDRKRRPGRASTLRWQAYSATPALGEEMVHLCRFS